MSWIATLTKGDGLKARVLRGSALTIIGYGSSQVIRLASNLILTRLLFPEAFGMMALVTVFMLGLSMFSDVGVGPSIMQSKRGDDQDFLNTAWTIQVMRGAGLFVFSVLIAAPIAHFYGEPQLGQLIPVAGVTLLIMGFNPTRLETAHRHLMLGRLTVIDIAVQLVAVSSAVLFAYLLQSVWALVLSGIFSMVVQLVAYDKFLPGKRNRFRWEKGAASELIGFGKWIFLSTVCGFLFLQSDKLILGKYLSLDILGIYNIGYFLASFPLLLAGMVSSRILIPMYREMPPSASAQNFRNIRKMRFTLTSGVLGLILVLAASGVALIDLMYDDRYVAAGAIVVIVACVQIPQVIILTYDQVALAAGDSKRFFIVAAARAVFFVAALLIGIEYAGVVGAIFSQVVAICLLYPVIVWLARGLGAWDPLHDVIFASVGLAGAVCIIWLNWAEIAALAEISTA